MGLGDTVSAFYDHGALYKLVLLSMDVCCTLVTFQWVVLIDATE